MLFRPDADDLRTIGRLTGKVVYAAGGAMLAHAALAWWFGEHNAALGFVIGAALALLAGAASQALLAPGTTLSASQGLATAALVWAVVPVFAAVPLLLSGHYVSALDAYFEAVSGLSATGLTLVVDLDHLPLSVNLWRHLLQLAGGVGVVVVALTIFVAAGGPLDTSQGREGRGERILPNVLYTARFVVRVAARWALVGVPALWLVLLQAGVAPATAVLHALSLFASAFGTAGFAPTSASVALYRSPAVETVLAVLMVAGAFGFVLHYQLQLGRRSALVRNLETRTLGLSVLVLFALAAVGLARSGTHTGAAELLRFGFFQVLSAHTTTGLTTVPERILLVDWGVLAPAMVVTAMALGGMSASTAGGIKVARVALLLKGLRRDVRTVLLPEDAVVVEYYHATSSRLLRDDEVRGAATVLLLYFGLYLTGGMVGLFYGYDLQLALFESTSAAANAGLSVGIVRPGLEWPLKALYLLEMLAGRLELVALFALAGYAVAVVRGRV